MRVEGGFGARVVESGPEADLDLGLARQPFHQPAAKPSVTDAAEDHRVGVPAHRGDDPPEMRPERPDPLRVDLGVVREAEEGEDVATGPLA